MRYPDKNIVSKRYERIFEIAERTVKDSVDTGGFAFSFVMQAMVSGHGSATRVKLRIDEVIKLDPRHEEQIHMARLYLALLELHFRRLGFHGEAIIAGNMAHQLASGAEDTRESLLSDGYEMILGTVSSAEDLERITPLPNVTDKEYMDLYEKLDNAWNPKGQGRMAKMMNLHLLSIHDYLPSEKIGADLFRKRRGRIEPLPLYVRNEISHPTIGKDRDLAAFYRDRDRGYVIMETWLKAGK